MVIKANNLNQVMEEIDELKKHLLQKLVRARVWGGKHTPLDFLSNGLPEHYRKTHQGKKILGEVLKELVNSEWIILAIKRTGKDSDEHVSLNPRKVAEIQQFLERIRG